MDPLVIALGAFALVLLVLFLAAKGKGKELIERIAERDKAVLAAKEETRRSEEEVRRVRAATEAAIGEVQQLFAIRLADAKAEIDQVRTHYNAESKRQNQESEAALTKALHQLQALEKYRGMLDEEGAATKLLAEAVATAQNLREHAAALVAAAETKAKENRNAASARAKEVEIRADAILDHATREAGRLLEEAHKNALAIGGDAYLALREKEQLERAVIAIRNIVDGYGDKYVVPTRSLLDDLSAEFSHTEAGQRLAAAREQTRRMVEEGQAATCDYAETVRRETAIRFVIDAFNGRVDAILTRTKHDNHGTLAQEIRDAFAIVNQNGVAFRNARVRSAYLDARLHELQWAVVAQELKLKEREEQRRLKEQIREEEKARREYERAIEDAEKEERTIQKALDKARDEAAKATAGQRAELESRIAELNEKLVIAEAKNQRALSMAQQTRKGTIYIISNVGSFGDDVFKIGMTRRLEPEDRIKELSDASVPFEFDVHAMIACDDAPALEAQLHREFDDTRINKVNYRKEFFRLSLERLRDKIVATGADVSFTMLAEAREYRETQALAKMSPEERAKYLSS
jgi:hypothetical protein